MQNQTSLVKLPVHNTVQAMHDADPKYLDLLVQLCVLQQGVGVLRDAKA